MYMLIHAYMCTCTHVNMHLYRHSTGNLNQTEANEILQKFV